MTAPAYRIYQRQHLSSCSFVFPAHRLIAKAAVNSISNQQKEQKHFSPLIVRSNPELQGSTYIQHLNRFELSASCIVMAYSEANTECALQTLANSVTPVGPAICMTCRAAAMSRRQMPDLVLHWVEYDPVSSFSLLVSDLHVVSVHIGPTYRTGWPGQESEQRSLGRKREIVRLFQQSPCLVV